MSRRRRQALRLRREVEEKQRERIKVEEKQRRGRREEKRQDEAAALAQWRPGGVLRRGDGAEGGPRARSGVPGRHAGGGAAMRWAPARAALALPPPARAPARRTPHDGAASG